MRMTIQRLALLAGLVAMTTAMVFVASSGAASPYTLHYDTPENGLRGPAFSSHHIGSIQIDPADVGKSCDVALAIDNDSRWQGTAVSLVASEAGVAEAGTTVGAADIEVGGDRTIPLGQLVVSATLDGYLTLGPGLDGRGLRPEWLGPDDSVSSITVTFTVTCPDTPEVPPETPEVEQPTTPAAPPAAPVVPATPRFTG